MRTLPHPSLLDLTVFRTAQEPLRGAHVLLTAVVGGEWAALEQEAREGVACERAAAVGAIEVSANAVEQAAREFRMRRGLATGDGMRTWLGQWNLAQPEWMAHVRRAALRTLVGPDAAHHVTQYGAPEHDVVRAMPALFASSPAIARVAHALASRAAALAIMAPAGPDDTAIAAAHTGLSAALPEPLPRAGFAAWSASDRQSALTTLARLDAAWARFATTSITPIALRDQLIAHRLDWVRVDYQLALFPSAAIANEAALCVREDGIALAAVAVEAGVPTTRICHCLDAEPPAQRAALLGASIGALLGPHADHGDFRLMQLIGKQLPSLDDPTISERASTAALQHASARATNDHVRWDVSW